MDMEEVQNEDDQGDLVEAQECLGKNLLEDKEEHGPIVHCYQLRLANM